MPVGDYTKDEIRKIAADNYLMVANKPDSMEICFVPDNDYAGYIERTTDYKSVPGNFVDVDGNVIGKHNGIIHYTVGQRKGLGLAMGHPVFVVAVRPDTNEVVIGENKDVFTDTLYAGNLNFMAIEALKEPMRARGKIRYSHEGADCTIRMIDDNTLECKFESSKGQLHQDRHLYYMMVNMFLVEELSYNEHKEKEAARSRPFTFFLCPLTERTVVRSRTERVR